MDKSNNKTMQRMMAETMQREFGLDARTIDEEARTVEMAFSSEAPVERWFGNEVLDHAHGAMRLGRLADGAALLLQHDADHQIGVVQSARIDGDKVGRAVVKFSRSDRGQEIFQDVVDGIRSKVSVGYRIHEAVLESTGDNGDTYRITDWEPYEISIVSIPADPSVGVGRSVSAAAESKAGAMPGITQRKEVVMDIDNKTTAAPAIDLDAARKEASADALSQDRTRIADIGGIADRAATIIGSDAAHEMARAAIEKGVAVDTFRASVLDAVEGKAKTQRSPEIGMTDNEVKDFSFLRLMNAMATNDWSNAGFERDVCATTAQRMGRKAKGALVPTDVLSRAVTTTGGAATIATEVLASSFIDLLRNRMVIRQMGATVLGGLSGNISIPRQSGGGSAVWVAEGAQPAQGTPTFDSVALNPNGVAGITQVTAQTLIQSSIDMEALIRNDLATTMALAIDLAAINGSGAAGQPLGILNTAGIGSATAAGGALTNADLLIDLEAALANVNADAGNMAYLTNSRVIAQMKKLKTTTGEYLWSNDAAGDYPSATLGDINGYRVARTNQVPANLGAGTNLSAILFGNWSDLLIGEWGALDLQVDPFTAGVGNIKVTALQFVDVAVRHPQSFAAISDILA